MPHVLTVHPVGGFDVRLFNNHPAFTDVNIGRNVENCMTRVPGASYAHGEIETQVLKFSLRVPVMAQ